MIITIDAGHTKNTNAGVIKGYYEGNAMFILANYLREELLRYKDTEVVLTRDENENPTLAERGSLAINSKSKIFISLHSNAVSNAESAAYVCGFYSVKREVSKELCTKLVSAVTNVMKETTDAWNRGALTKKNSAGSDYYGVLRSSVAGKSEVEYSFIIEHGFHTNKKECEFLMDDKNLRKIAEAEVKVLAEYFDLKLRNAKIYNVEIGPFKGETRAEEVVEKVKQAGFSNARIIEAATLKTVEDFAKEIIDGKWGLGHAMREAKLKEAGWLELYTYEEIRIKVNEIYK